MQTARESECARDSRFPGWETRAAGGQVESARLAKARLRGASVVNSRGRKGSGQDIGQWLDRPATADRRGGRIGVTPASFPLGRQGAAVGLSYVLI